MKYIQSTDNKYIKLVKSLQQGKYRQKYSMFFDEGIKNIELSLKSNYHMNFAIAREDFIDNPLIKQLEYKLGEDKVLVLSEKLFSTISDTVNSQGIIAVFDMKKDDVIKSDKLLILDRIQDPGNIGTIIRTAESFSINTIFYTKGTADIFSPKVVRSTMGSIYFVNFLRLDYLTKLKSDGYRIYASCLENSISAKGSFTDEKIALILGNESVGVSQDLIMQSDKKIKIYMTGNAQSLNVATAGAILIYEMCK